MNKFRRAKIIEIPEPKRIIIRNKKHLEQMAPDASEFEWWKH
jgi:hypothetical protein